MSNMQSGTRHLESVQYPDVQPLAERLRQQIQGFAEEKRHAVSGESGQLCRRPAHELLIGFPKRSTCLQTVTAAFTALAFAFCVK
ncbi:hypothetical protein ACFTAO_14650 [Paenibacillus rhizoplanae]